MRRSAEKHQPWFRSRVRWGKIHRFRQSGAVNQFPPIPLEDLEPEFVDIITLGLVMGWLACLKMRRNPLDGAPGLLLQFRIQKIKRLLDQFKENGQGEQQAGHEAGAGKPTGRFAA